MIWLLRHGDAEPHGGADADRELTEKGRRQARDAGRALAALGVEIEVCLASPKVRAVQTARIACEELGMEPEIEERLRGGLFDVRWSWPPGARCCWSGTSQTSRPRSPS